MPPTMAATDEAVKRWKARCKTWEERYLHERNSADQERDWARELEEENEALREQIVRLTALVGSDDGGGRGGLCAKCGGSCAEDDAPAAARGYMPQQQAPSTPRQQMSTSTSTQDDGNVEEGPPLTPAIAASQSPPRPVEYMSPDDDDDDDDEERAPSVATASSISAALDRINEVLRAAPSAALQPDEGDGYTSALADVDAEPVASSSTRTYQSTDKVGERSMIHQVENGIIDNNIGKSPHTSSATPAKSTSRDESIMEQPSSRLPPLGSPSNPQHAASASGTPMKVADGGQPAAYVASHALEEYPANNTEKEDAEVYDSNRRVEEKSDDHSLASRDSILSSPNQRLFNLVRTFGGSDSGSVVGGSGSFNGDTGSVVSDIRSEVAASTTSPNLSHAYRRMYQGNATYTTAEAKENKTAPLDPDGRTDARSTIGSVVSDVGPRGIPQHTQSKRSGKYANFTSALMAGVSVSPPRPSSDAGFHVFANGERIHDSPTIDWTPQGVDPPQQGVTEVNSAQASNTYLEASSTENADKKPAPISPLSPGRKWTHPRRQRLQRAMEAKTRAEREAIRLTEQKIGLDPEPEQEI
mmetsp:Transcript_30259/g.66543  ORF Transcript_30259/g.66543 Transcript_30259/m.66543 type:complete len:586 (-) Transcript_30259:87-1844(-)